MNIAKNLKREILVKEKMKRRMYRIVRSGRSGLIEVSWKEFHRFGYEPILFEGKENISQRNIEYFVTLYDSEGLRQELFSFNYRMFDLPTSFLPG